MKTLPTNVTNSIQCASYHNRCYYWQINTPRYAFIYEKDDVIPTTNSLGLTFPLFVKHFHGYNSVGITEKVPSYVILIIMFVAFTLWRM